MIGGLEEGEEGGVPTGFSFFREIREREKKRKKHFSFGLHLAGVDLRLGSLIAVWTRALESGGSNAFDESNKLSDDYRIHGERGGNDQVGEGH